jgi:hypothetical protein
MITKNTLNRVYHFGYETFESLISASSYTATALFQITTSAYGLFAIACDGNSGTYTYI